MTEQTVVRGRWRTLSETEKQIVRVRPIWASGVSTPIAEEFRVDQQTSDSWVEWIKITPAHKQFTKVEDKIKTPRKAPEGMVRNAQGKFYKA